MSIGAFLWRSAHLKIQDIFKNLEETKNESKAAPNKVYLHYVVLANYTVDDIDFDRIDVSDTFVYAPDVENSVGHEDDSAYMYFFPGSLIGNIIATSEIVNKMIQMPKSPLKTRHFL